MNNKQGIFLFLRYLFLLLVGLFNLELFYLIFSPLTVYPVFGFLYLFDDKANLLAGQLLFFKGNYASLIPACIAGAAYYMLLILNLSTPMDVKKRAISVALLIFSFLVINILRIIFFIFLLSSGPTYFDLAHKFVWYFGSTMMVVALWFFNVWLLEIHTIPVYTDAKRLIHEIA